MFTECIVSDAQSSFDGPVAEILEETIPVVFPVTTDAHELNEQFKLAHANSLPHRLAGQRNRLPSSIAYA